MWIVDSALRNYRESLSMIILYTCASVSSNCRKIPQIYLCVSVCNSMRNYDN